MTEITFCFILILIPSLHPTKHSPNLPTPTIHPPMMSTVGSGDHHPDNYKCPSPHHSLPFRLLEVTVISAQDLHPATCHITTYATAWVNSDYKLHTRVDTTGRTDPSWNDKFIFRVDEAFLRSETSSITIDIYASASFRKDPIIGTARILLSTVDPSSSTRFVALQVRRPKSLRPQGILNVGVALLDVYIHNMPLDPAFIIKDIMDSPCRSLPRTSHVLSHHTSFGRIPENEEWQQKEQLMNGEEWKLERINSAEVGPRMVQQEAEELESKLEKWRIDLSPEHDAKKNQGKHRRSVTMPACFCGGSVMD